MVKSVTKQAKQIADGVIHAVTEDDRGRVREIGGPVL
jgi:hypothetical protein